MENNIFGFLSLLISIIALVLSGSKSSNPFSTVDMLNFLSITITSIAFMIGCFFAYMAVQAYRQLREIEKKIEETEATKKIMEKELNDFLSAKNEVVSGIVETINFMHETAAEFVMILLNPSSGEAPEKILGKSQEQISKKRGNLFFLKILPTEEREAALRYIIQFGNESDLEKLEKIIADTSESPYIRNLANDAYSKLLQRRVRE